MKLLLALGLAAQVIGGSGLRGVNVVTSSSQTESTWRLSYTPYAYPHPLQSAWVSSCEDTHAARSHSRAHVQDAVNAADDDDCVTVPTGDGAETWTGAVGWSNKRIQVIGPGEANLTITCQQDCFDITVNRTPTRPFRISGFTLAWSAAINAIDMHGVNANAVIEDFRIDHITFLGTSTRANSISANGGIWWGLVDHVTHGDGSVGWLLFYAAGHTLNDFDIPNRCAPTGGAFCTGYDSWNLKSLEFGSRNAIYIEDSALNNDPSSGRSAVNDMEYGVRMVYRFSTSLATFYQSHSARGQNRGGNIQSEVYRNTFTGENFFRPALMLGGALMFFENTVSGYQNNQWDIGGQRENTACVVKGAPLDVCDGTRAWDANTDANGWKCLDAIGQGAVARAGTSAAAQSRVPAKSWMNGSTSTCATGGACNNTTGFRLNGVCTGLSAYLKPRRSPHANGQWDFMNYGDGVTVVTNVSDLPGSCTAGEWAWVTNDGSWNTLGQDGRGYICQ